MGVNKHKFSIKTIEQCTEFTQSHHTQKKSFMSSCLFFIDLKEISLNFAMLPLLMLPLCSGNKLIFP